TVKLFGRKDRPAWHERHGHDRRIGTITFNLRDPEHPVTLRLERGAEAEEGERWMPTALMERLSRWAEQRSEPGSMTTIEQSVSGKDKYVRQAVLELVRLGHFDTVPGRRSGDVKYRSARPYREGDEDEPGPNPARPDGGNPAQPGPEPGPAETRST